MWEGSEKMRKCYELGPRWLRNWMPHPRDGVSLDVRKALVRVEDHPLVVVQAGQGRDQVEHNLVKRGMRNRLLLK